MSNIKNIIYYIIYLIVSVSFIILLIEFAGRAILNFKYGVSGKSYGLWQADDELGADHAPNGYNSNAYTNDWGFRNVDNVIEPKPKNGLRVIAFGGSTTFGYNLNQDQTFTQQLQNSLRKEAGLEQSEVLNAGRIMFCSAHNLILMKKLVPKLKPDYAVLYDGINDYTNTTQLLAEGQDIDNLMQEKKYGLIAKGYDQNRWLKRNSVIIRIFDYYIASLIPNIILSMRENKRQDVSQGKVEKIYEWTYENYQHTLGDMVNYLKSQNVKVIIVRYAIVKQAEGMKYVAPQIDSCARINANVANAMQVPLYDMENSFNQLPNKSEYFINSGVHVTAEGAKRVASDLIKIIQEQQKK